MDVGGEELVVAASASSAPRLAVRVPLVVGRSGKATQSALTVTEPRLVVAEPGTWSFQGTMPVPVKMAAEMEVVAAAVAVTSS